LSGKRNPIRLVPPLARATMGFAEPVLGRREATI
jgi:hypothetical protein